MTNEHELAQARLTRAKLLWLDTVMAAKTALRDRVEAEREFDAARQAAAEVSP